MIFAQTAYQNSELEGIKIPKFGDGFSLQSMLKNVQNFTLTRAEWLCEEENKKDMILDNKQEIYSNI